MKFLSGYKTYITLAAGVVVAWLVYFTSSTEGDPAVVADLCAKATDGLTLQEAIEISWAAVAGMFLRRGIAKV